MRAGPAGALVGVDHPCQFDLPAKVGQIQMTAIDDELFDRG